MKRKKPFLSGRNGPDAFSMTASLSACVLLIIAMFVGGTISSVLWLLALICLIFCYFRIFSRNIPRRRAENQRFLTLIAPLTQLHGRFREKKRQKNLYCFFQCPQCGTVLRVPKGKGHIRITCKCCKHIFERNS